MTERGETRVAVDLVAFGLVEGELSVLMGRRPHAPYEGFWALPGEFRHSGQSVDELAWEVLDRTTDVERARVEQLATFDRPPVVDECGEISTPGRDPRGEIVSVAYMAVVGADRVREDYGGDLGWQAGRRGGLPLIIVRSWTTPCGGCRASSGTRRSASSCWPRSSRCPSCSTSTRRFSGSR